MAKAGAEEAGTGGEEVGRRERKKLRTRQVISDLATRLFIERGFDHVTVAEVARAADVAVQTVFNHFPAKEDLFFDEQGWWVGPAQAIRETPPGEDVIEALEQHYLSGIQARLRSGHLATWKEFTRTIEESPALLARRRKNAEEMETLMVEALRERDPRLTPLMAQLIAAQYAAAQKVLETELARLVPDKPSGVQLAHADGALTKAVGIVFGALKQGLKA
ncbi:TetR/AcrR family transcriptional regulator [Kribbella catacumbae]|uniref:TetR/AcrR family transcriptional regulator n=1 Tax=Kribbella catacumbae TaxID=460086 RepID=UPI0003703479|nr:TetR/AcrR family transcriptional regulator [Kribbella catacumbae]